KEKSERKTYAVATATSQDATTSNPANIERRIIPDQITTKDEANGEWKQVSHTKRRL
ncbi:unnamed protein product, partial [Allacma fusca]